MSALKRASVRSSVDAAPNEFWECESCRRKTGSPTLCASCLHNRGVVGKLWDEIGKLQDELSKVR